MPDLTKLGAHSPDEEAERIDAVCGVYAGKSETPRCDAIALRLTGVSGRFCDDKSLLQYNDLLAEAKALEKETARLREALFRMCCAADELLADTQHKTHDCGDEWCPAGGMRAQLGHARALLSPAPTERADK